MSTKQWKSGAGCAAALMMAGMAAGQAPYWDTTGHLTDRPAIATAPDGKLYLIARGTEHQGDGVSCFATTLVRKYDPLTGAMSSAAPLPQMLCATAAITAPDGRIYTVGGRSGMGPHPPAANTVFSFDAAANAWTALPPMNVKRSSPAVAIGADGRLWAFGGLDDYNQPIPSIESMDPLSVGKTWTVFGPASLPAGMSGWRAVTNNQGAIYLADGAGHQYRFDPAAPPYLTAVTPTPALPVGKPFAMTLGPDDFVHYIHGPGFQSYRLWSSSLNAAQQDTLFDGEFGRVQAEPAEGAVYAAGNMLQFFGPLKANVGPGKLRWRFENNAATAPCNPGAPLQATAGYGPGRVGQAASFNGGQEIRYAASPCFNVGGGSFTIDFWISPGAVNGTQSVIDHRDAATKGYHVALYRSGNKTHILLQMNAAGWGGHKNYGSAPVEVRSNEWTHVAFTVSRPGMGPLEGKVWINGALASVFTPVAGSLNNTGAFRIGSHSSGGAGFNGRLDDLQITPYAMTWHQVRQVFLAGREGKN